MKSKSDDVDEHSIILSCLSGPKICLDAVIKYLPDKSGFLFSSPSPFSPKVGAFTFTLKP